MAQWESACQCKGLGFDPWSWKTPHATGQLSPSATTTEPALYSHALQQESSPRSLQPEKAQQPQ